MTRIPGPSFGWGVGIITVIGPLAIHLFFPAIPAVKAAFGLSDAMAQFTFSVAVFGMAFATLVYGSLADRYGRRAVLLSGLGFFLAQPRFTALVLQTGFSTGTFMILGSAASTLMKELLGRPATEFGIYFVLLPIGFISGPLISSRLGNRASTEAMVLIGSLLCLAAVAIQAVLLLSGHVSPLAFFLPWLSVTMAQGIALPYAQAGAMATIPPAWA